MVQNGRIKNCVRSLGPRGLNQIEVGTDRRHVLRTFYGMSHEITYTGPLSTKEIMVKLGRYISCKKNNLENICQNNCFPRFIFNSFAFKFG